MARTDQPAATADAAGPAAAAHLRALSVALLQARLDAITGLREITSLWLQPGDTMAEGVSRIPEPAGSAATELLEILRPVIADAESRAGRQEPR